jgi:Holliday junction resolvasome RuvABC endonuclease subunit
MNHVYRPFVLAFYPSSRGFAFVLFQGPHTPFDWGVIELRGKQKNARTLQAFTKLIAQYAPDVLVIEDTESRDSRRHTRIRALYRMAAHVAKMKGISVIRFTHSEVHASFGLAGSSTKYEIAQAIAKEIPAFASRLPPVRKIWMSEDPRQNLFDAASLGFTFYRIHQPQAEK